jgi:hypothetical protein
VQYEQTVRRYRTLHVDKMIFNAATETMKKVKVRRCKLTRAESAWFQCLKLNYD